jgi:very-short-patch-repair endonuclease
MLSVHSPPVLDASPGAVLHGRSALAWLGLRGFNLREIHVARPRGQPGAVPTLGRLYRLRQIRAHDVIVVRGVPTETALRAIWIEAARYARPPLAEVGHERIGRLLDQAHRKGLVTWAALHEMVDGLHERGRSGTAIMRVCADERPPGSSPTESRSEAELEKILANAGQPALRRQVVLGGHEPIGRVDFCDGELPLAVEVNSLTYHTAPSDRQADEIRYRRLNDAGFTVAVVWEDDLWGNPRDVVRTIVEAREHARRCAQVVVHSTNGGWEGWGGCGVSDH